MWHLVLLALTLLALALALALTARVGWVWRRHDMTDEQVADTTIYAPPV